MRQWIIALSCNVGGTLLAFNTQNLHTLGFACMQTSDSLDANASVAFVDSDSVISPPDAKTIDRRIDTSASIYGHGHIRSDLAAFWDIDFENSYAKADQDSDVSTPSISRKSQLTQDIAINWQNSAGVHFIVGARSLFLFSESKESNTLGIGSAFKKRDLFLFAPEIAVGKSASSWQAYVYFIRASEGSRKFVKTVSGFESIEGQSKDAIPAAFGLSAAFASEPFQFALNLESIKAASSGETSESGEHIHDDYLKIIGIINWRFDAAQALAFSVAHQTLSYSDSAFTSIDNIPINSLHADLIWGNKDSHVNIGVIFGFGRDEASIPEYNREFKMTAMGISSGVLATF